MSVATRKKERLGIINGYYQNADRRTFLDQRSGIVIDITQAGNDDRPLTVIEVYAYATGATANATELKGRNPWYSFEATHDTEGTE